MSTRSLINVKVNEDKVLSVYCHFDGYGHLPILENHYNSQEKAEALVALGDMSSLAESIDCPKGHSFDHQVDGYCVFYGRDRGEDNVGPREFFDLSLARKQDRSQQYIYEWDGTHWSIAE